MSRAGPRSDRDKVIGHSALSVGYGREVGMIMLIYIMAFAYAACSPIILPFTLCYFTSAWVSRLQPLSSQSAPLLCPALCACSSPTKALPHLVLM